LEVSESSTSLTGESHSDATDADASVLANDPTPTSCLGNHYGETPKTVSREPLPPSVALQLVPLQLLSVVVEPALVVPVKLGGGLDQMPIGLVSPGCW
jgi:hypothetical protein